MPLKDTKISLIYFVILTLMLVGLAPLLLTGWLLSEKSGNELRTVENRYQTQLVQDKARQIEVFTQNNSTLLDSIVNSLELSENLSLLSNPATEERLGQMLKENSGLIGLYVKPVVGESISLFKQDQLDTFQIENLSENAILKQTGNKLTISEPSKLNANGDSVITMSRPVKILGSHAADVVGVVSLKEISKFVVGEMNASEDVFWERGLPMVFVVDENGVVLFHPDRELVNRRASLTNLKIVQEWQEASNQIQSGLLPFSTTFGEKDYDMIGAYSTVRVGGEHKYGVIIMQDERKALASVDEMRWQTWMISIAFAFIALVIGFIATRMLTSPLFRLSSAAERIAAGDLTTRVDTNNVTEIGSLGRSFNVMSDRIEQHIAQLAKAAQENRELFVGTVKALAAAIDGKDKYTRGHSERVARISVEIAKEMGLGEEEIEKIRISALLHDVGKIAVDDAILKKPSALTDEEFAIMKTHPMEGYKIMSQIPAMKDFLPGMLWHHEMVNGKGYPEGKFGNEIPLQAKIISVADTFDAMTIDRPYQKGMLMHDALDRINKFVGERYDKKVVDALIKGCDTGQIGRGIVQKRALEHKMLQTDKLPDIPPALQANKHNVEEHQPNLV